MTSPDWNTLSAAEQIKICGLKDEVGNRYGSLVVQEYIGDKKWRCLCDCGRTHEVRGRSLRSGKSTRCRSCASKESVFKEGKPPQLIPIDETGNQHGKLKVLGPAGLKKWRCVCECGKERIVNGTALRTGRVKACKSCVRRKSKNEHN